MAFETAPVRGVVQHYNARYTNQKFGATVDPGGTVKEAVYVFDGDDLPASGDQYLSFPAYSKIVGGYAEILEDTADIGDRTALSIPTTIGDATALDFSLASADGTFRRGTADSIVIDPPIDVGATAAKMVVGTMAGSGGSTGTYDGSGRFRVVVRYVLEAGQQHS